MPPVENSSMQPLRVESNYVRDFEDHIAAIVIDGPHRREWSMGKRVADQARNLVSRAHRISRCLGITHNSANRIFHRDSHEEGCRPMEEAGRKVGLVGAQCDLFVTYPLLPV